MLEEPVVKFLTAHNCAIAENKPPHTTMASMTVPICKARGMSVTAPIYGQVSYYAMWWWDSIDCWPPKHRHLNAQPVWLCQKCHRYLSLPTTLMHCDKCNSLSSQNFALQHRCPHPPRLHPLTPIFCMDNLQTPHPWMLLNVQMQEWNN